MIEYLNKFLILKEEKGESITFGNNAFARIDGKGTISLIDGKNKT